MKRRERESEWFQSNTQIHDRRAIAQDCLSVSQMSCLTDHCFLVKGREGGGDVCFVCIISGNLCVSVSLDDNQLQTVISVFLSLSLCDYFDFRPQVSLSLVSDTLQLLVSLTWNCDYTDYSVAWLERFPWDREGTKLKYQSELSYHHDDCFRSLSVHPTIVSGCPSLPLSRQFRKETTSFRQWSKWQFMMMIKWNDTWWQSITVRERQTWLDSSNGLDENCSLPWYLYWYNDI